ncbi:SLATT domain-containing protein [Falsiroseomonas oryziterrae]|uniref:SLATT domain-containing protein n=1 Tax=Falsiroseomonas oryziterrae TaxID=2911368 RepID=UPI001F254C56|nr:SLATT domain-containing protein [Roseomonas sp. NPKOSM-4]
MDVGAAPDRLAPLEREAAELEYQCLMAERAHFDAGYWAFQRYKFWGLSAALLGALTTGSALEVVGTLTGLGGAERTAITGVLALLLTIATTVLNFLDPKGQRDRHEAVAKRLAALRAEVRLFRRAGGAARDGAEEVFARLLARHAEILAEAPGLNDRRHHAAKDQLFSNAQYRDLRRLTGRGEPKRRPPGVLVQLRRRWFGAAGTE